MWIFTLSIFMLGCFAPVSCRELDGKLLRALKNIQHTSRESAQDTKPRTDEPITSLNINGKQLQSSLLLPVNLHNKNSKLELRPPDEDHDLQHNSDEIQTGIIIPDTPPKERVLANIVELKNGHDFKKLSDTVPVHKGDTEKIQELEIAHPANTRISNVLWSDGLQPNDLKPAIMRNWYEINDDTKPETVPPEKSIKDEREAGIDLQQKTHPNVMTNSGLKQKATTDRFNGIPHNSMSSQNGMLEDDHGNSHLQTNIDINNNLQQEVQQQNSTNEIPKCSLRQTMAWEVCNKKMPCSSTCKTGDDCTFPYCNSLGQCECREAECSSDRMCYFWRIDCHGRFRCRNSKCICE